MEALEIELSERLDSFVALRAECLEVQAARDADYETLQLVEALCEQHPGSEHAAAILDIVRAAPEGSPPGTRWEASR